MWRQSKSNATACFSQNVLERNSHSWVWMMYLRRSNRSLGIRSEYSLKNLARTSGSGFCSPQQNGRSTLVKTSSPKLFSVLVVISVYKKSRKSLSQTWRNTVGIACNLST